jgi:hypothetical protein
MDKVTFLALVHHMIRYTRELVGMNTLRRNGHYDQRACIMSDRLMSDRTHRNKPHQLLGRGDQLLKR